MSPPRLKPPYTELATRRQLDPAGIQRLSCPLNGVYDTNNLRAVSMDAAEKLARGVGHRAPIELPETIALSAETRRGVVRPAIDAHPGFLLMLK